LEPAMTPSTRTTHSPAPSFHVHARHGALRRLVVLAISAFLTTAFLLDVARGTVRPQPPMTQPVVHVT
jgi:hypothetical protein